MPSLRVNPNNNLKVLVYVSKDCIIVQNLLPGASIAEMDRNVLKYDQRI